MSEQVKVARAAGIVGTATLASRIMGYVRDMVMSWAFGTGLAADAFYVAYRIPNMLRELLAEGSMSAAFIPVFTQTLTSGSRDEARRLARATFARLIVLLAVLTTLGIIFAPYLVQAIAWGFRADQTKYDLTVTLTRVMFPYLFFIGLAALAMGMLNSLRSFLAPASSPVMYNLVTIAAVLFLAPQFADPILGVGIGVVAGGMAQLLIQVPHLKKHDMLIRPQFTPSHPGVAQIGRLALPVLLGSSVTQINIFVSTILASFLATGSITYLFYGMRFIHFPLGVFGIAIATAILPTMAAQAVRREMPEFRETLSLGLRLVLFITIPAMVGLVTLRIPIVNLMLERGEFDWISTVGTADAILFYAVGLWAFAGVRIVSQAFYSLQDTRTPVKIAVLALVVNIVLSLLLMRPLAHGGLALATSLAAVVNLGLLTVKLRKKIGRMDGRRILRSLIRIVPTSAVMGLISWWISTDAVWRSSGVTLYKIELLAGGIAGSAVFYFVAMWLLKSEEMTFLRGMMKRGK
ncbi:MAG: murein biosynthesis integral membrane protein MurJ [Nitrospirae bacterium GWC2_57_13]|jgi:putative peptidoglycan lipid II flippase|nr:MAG: murein biosynthesis integral membrane protein MurJ [Nitrospirae bacterium GWC1_57_7]OGW27927.1 MAG: murein biosynthesis integral membrane protein MurJ [Nitrospirae bacterium GWC2_57_13]OGW40563.1 MAG: murein biosynthesis integral membrane protein MurJ [Nitrospirae bacterium GWD2_57_8]HAR45800.1 murein biosynthesis integral membrane protein MurJ [Nitrospiraceae bacterium]